MRTGRTATFFSAGVHGVLVLVLWTTVTIAVRPPEGSPREFRSELAETVPLAKPPLPLPETPEVVLDEEPPPVAEIEEVTPETELASDPLFDEPAPAPVASSPILLPSSPCRAAGVLRPRRRAPAPAPAAPPREFRPAPPKPVGITCVAAPAEGNSRPRYPDRAVERRWEGVVLLLVVVRADGTVEDVTVLKSSGHAILDRAAIRAVRGWTFVPAKRNGRAVAGEVEQAVRFTLQ